MIPNAKFDSFHVLVTPGKKTIMKRGGATKLLMECKRYIEQGIVCNATMTRVFQNGIAVMCGDGKETHIVYGDNPIIKYHSGSNTEPIRLSKTELPYFAKFTEGGVFINAVVWGSKAIALSMYRSRGIKNPKPTINGEVYSFVWEPI